MDKDKIERKVHANNRKAFHEYSVMERLVCGIELIGNEVKSIKSGKVSIKESWVSIENGEMIIKQMHVTKWETSNLFDVADETRERKLLATKKQIRNWARQLQLKGYTIVPLSVFEERGKIKIEVGLAVGKHNYDKRQDAKVKSMKKEASRF